jgi:transposase
LSDEEFITAYKDQKYNMVRFLKDPLFMASTVFLKSPNRIMALMRVLCLLFYAALGSSKSTRHGLSDQKYDTTEIPSARWVFQYFSGIHVLLLPKYRCSS